MSEEFDDIMRQKFAEKEFIFNEENWEKAEIKINAAKRLKKILLWSSLFTIGLITGICFMFLLKKDKQTENIKVESKQTTEEQIKGRETPAFSSHTNKTEMQETDNSNTNSTSNDEIENQLNQHNTINQENGSNLTSAVSENTIPATDGNNSLSAAKYHPDKKENVNTTIDNLDQLKKIDAKKNKKYISEKEQLKNKKDNPLHATTATQKNERVITQDKVVDKHNRKKTNNLIDSSADEQLEKVNANALTSAKNSTKKKNNKNNAATITTTKNIKEATTKKADLVENKEQKEVVKKNGLAPKNISMTDSTEATDSAKATIADSALALKNELKTPATDSLNDSLKVATLADSVNAKKDSINKAADPSAPLGLDGLASINLFNIDAGANGQIGWNSPGGREAQGVTPVFGISLLHYFNQKWSVSAGVHYSNISYLKTNTLNIVTSYSFGSIIQTSMFKPYNLHYISVPLYLNYHVNEKNAIFTGASFSYLLNNKIRVQSVQTSIVTFNSVPVTNSPTEIRKHFYNDLDVSLLVGYRRKLNAHFSISPIFYFGLVDIKKDASFGNLNQFERNSGLKVILSYTIFDF